MFITTTGHGGSGTCILIGQNAQGDTLGLILTNKHVVPTGNSPIKVRWTSGVSQDATWVAVDPQADLGAIVVSATPATPCIPLARTHPVAGDEVWQVGYPMGKLTQRAGKVVGYRVTDGPRMFIPSFRINSGDSGSGVFLVREKALCAVMWGDGQGESVGVEWKVCKSFVEERCLFWRKRPPDVFPPPVAPAPGGPTSPGPPIGPTPPLLPNVGAAHEKIASLENKLAALEGKVGALPNEFDARVKAGLAQVHNKVDAVHGAIQAQDSKLAGFSTLPLKLSELEARLKAAADNAKFTDDKVNAIPDLTGPVGDIHASLNKISGKLNDIPVIQPDKIAAIETAVGWSKYLPWIAAGGATGGASLLVPLIGVGLSLLKRRAAQSPGGPRDPAPPFAAPIVPTADPASPAPASPPATHEMKFVPTPVQNAELQALLKAMEVAGQSYPGTQSTINLLQDLKKQLMSKPAAAGV